MLLLKMASILVLSDKHEIKTMAKSPGSRILTPSRISDKHDSSVVAVIALF
jgi:hypothetical protein